MPNFKHCYLNANGSPDVILENEYISIGINNCGCHGTTNSAPSGYHPIKRTTIGMCINQNGFSSGIVPIAGDIFLPGSPSEGFIVSYNGKSYTNNRNGVLQSTPYVSIEDLSVDVDKKLSCLWKGKIVNEYELNILYSLNELDKYVKVDVVYKNVSNVIHNNVSFERFIDPDQDFDLYGTYTTINSIVSQYSTDSITTVKSVGEITLDASALMLISLDPRSVGLINNTIQPKGYVLKQDCLIGIRFVEPVVNPNSSVTFTYFLSLDSNISNVIDNIKTTTMNIDVTCDEADKEFLFYKNKNITLNISPNDSNSYVYDIDVNDTSYSKSSNISKLKESKKLTFDMIKSTNIINFKITSPNIKNFKINIYRVIINNTNNLNASKVSTSILKCELSSFFGSLSKLNVELKKNDNVFNDIKSSYMIQKIFNYFK